MSVTQNKNGNSQSNAIEIAKVTFDNYGNLDVFELITAKTPPPKISRTEASGIKIDEARLIYTRNKDSNEYSEEVVIYSGDKVISAPAKATTADKIIPFIKNALNDDNIKKDYTIIFKNAVLESANGKTSEGINVEYSNVTEPNLGTCLYTPHYSTEKAPKIKLEISEAGELKIICNNFYKNTAFTDKTNSRYITPKQLGDEELQNLEAFRNNVIDLFCRGAVALATPNPKITNLGGNNISNGQSIL